MVYRQTHWLQPKLTIRSGFRHMNMVRFSQDVVRVEIELIAFLSEDRRHKLEPLAIPVSPETQKRQRRGGTPPYLLTAFARQELHGLEPLSRLD